MLNHSEFDKTDIMFFNISNILFGSFILAILNGFYYCIFELSFSNCALSFVSAGLILILIRIAKTRKYSQRISNLFVIFLAIVLLPVAWITTYGAQGPMLYYAFLFIVMSSLLSSTKLSYVISICIVIEVYVLWKLEPFYYDVIHKISSTYNAQNNLVHNYVTAGMILCLFMFINRKNTTTSQKLLLEYSMIDELTTLYNRRYFFDRINAIHSEAERNKRHYQILMIDIDNFKKINDIYGHQIGDQVLRSIGSIIKRNIRPYDVGCRYGGDEFIIIISTDDVKVLEEVKNRIQAAFEEVSKEYPSENLGLSIGSADSKESTIEELIHIADCDLYSIKSQKKSKI